MNASKQFYLKRQALKYALAKFTDSDLEAELERRRQVPGKPKARGTKAEWARDKAADLRRDAESLRGRRGGGLAKKYGEAKSAEQLEAEAQRFDGLARVFEEKGQ